LLLHLQFPPGDRVNGPKVAIRVLVYKIKSRGYGNVNTLKILWSREKCPEMSGHFCLLYD